MSSAAGGEAREDTRGPSPSRPGLLPEVTAAAYRAARSVRWLRTLAKRVRDPIVVDAGYRAILQREPDPLGRRDFLDKFGSGDFTIEQFGRELLESAEFERVSTKHDLVLSLHRSRCRFVRSLVPARRILDLGGTSLQHEHGAMVTMGYPYDFEELVIVDLPPDERHPLYNRGGVREGAMSPQGKITYAYHSMADLSPYPDDSFDLVYSGQSIEHVTVDEADEVLASARRVLRRGGLLVLDTPNGRVTRLQQEAFIDPDHKYEYTAEELDAKLSRAGFDVVERKGLNLGLRSVATGIFDEAEFAENVGIFSEPGSCYVLAYVCRKP